MVISPAPLTYEIRALDSLPWPAGLGKDLEYPNLTRRLQRLLGGGYGNPSANRHAFESDPAYREVLLAALTRAPWASDVAEIASAAAELARGAPLLGEELVGVRQEAWWAWAKQYGDQLRVHEWLTRAVCFTTEGLFMSGRHRLTYLRLVRGPEFEVLVQISHSR